MDKHKVIVKNKKYEWLLIVSMLQKCFEELSKLKATSSIFHDTNFWNEIQCPAFHSHNPNEHLLKSNHDQRGDCELIIKIGRQSYN